MAHSAKARTKYGDLKGTISIDGFDGLTLMQFGSYLPEYARGKYVPVGLEVVFTRQSEINRLQSSVILLAVDRDCLGPDVLTGIEEYANEHGSLPVFSFPSDTLTFEKLLLEIKNVNIIVHGRNTYRWPLEILDHQPNFE